MAAGTKSPFRTSTDTLFFLQNFHHFGLNAVEAMYLQQMLSMWWLKDSLPFPSNKMMSKRMGISVSSIKRIRKKLEDLGLIDVAARYYEDPREEGYTRQTSNTVDPGPFVDAMKRLQKGKKKGIPVGQIDLGRGVNLNPSPQVKMTCHINQVHTHSSNEYASEELAEIKERVKAREPGRGLSAAPQRATPSDEVRESSESVDQGRAMPPLTPGIFIEDYPECRVVVWNTIEELAAAVERGEARWPMAESIEERKARLERVTGQAKAKQKAAASRRMERALKKEKHRENLKGNTRPISKKKLIAGLEEVWQEKMQDRYPDLKLPKWSAKERGQALHLIEQFDTSLAALLVRYSVETWSGISTRFFKRDSVPSIGSVLRFSGSLVIEAQTWKIYADAEAAYQATRKDPSDPYDYGDDELYQKSERARRACVEAGIFDK